VETSEPEPPDPGEKNAHRFVFFRAIADQIVFGAPLYVYAKSLGASATVMGIIASFMPLMSLTQMAGAKYLERHSYRNFALMGQNSRVVFSLLIASIPLLFFLSPSVKLAILLFAIFGVNLSRLTLTIAWMPWMTAVIPGERRGHFLSINHLFTVLGSLTFLLVAGSVMYGEPVSWKYTVIFALSGVGALLSQYFLRRIPEAIAAESSQSSHPVPWGAMLRYRPFAKVLILNLLWVGTLGSFDAFRISFLREQQNLSPTNVLFLAAFSFIGAALVLPYTSRILDRVGSKPMLQIACLLYIAPIIVWFLMAAEVMPCTYWSPAFLYTSTGAGWGIFTVANNRALMATIPNMGRNHFFALYSLVFGISMGITPIAWGMILDALRNVDITTGALHWKRYSIYFFGLLVLNILAFFQVYLLEEAPQPGNRRKPAQASPAG